ncbi:MAG TPA: transcription antitermination factor NusB [Terracidiphilus sp.]|nr:transcription antitermination factor NusB [Terracidiphilus sp.]
MGALSAARKAAFEILLAVERGRAHSDELLRKRRVEALSAPDRNLATALVMDVLRWQLHLDGKIQPLLKRPGAKLDPEIRIALRLGALQLLRMDRIPARAAIDESVELAKQAGHRFAAGMVNAVLRRLAAEAWRDRDADVSAAVESHPAWMVERWTAIYGAETTQAICLYGQCQPAAAIRLGDADAEAELMGEGVHLRPGGLLTAARVVAAGDMTRTAAFRAGRVRTQDEGSQLVAECVERGGTILDCCAAPGGKALILAERNPQARIVACEVSARRLAQMQRRLGGLGASVECRLADAAAMEDEAAHDAVLCDVPCSGTGTLGRNPEIRHRLRPKDLPRQAERQRAILLAALRAVKPGGRVVYSTCSLEPEENDEVVRAVMADRVEARTVSLSRRIGELESEGILTGAGAAGLRDCLTEEGWLRLTPGRFKQDGFFIALLERVV